MKKIFTFMMMACVAMAAHAELVLTYQDAAGNTVTADKDMTVNVVSMNPEEYELELHGTIEGAFGPLTIEVARQEEGVLDVCCAAGDCINGNGELTQTNTYNVTTNNTWFTHVEAPEGQDTYQTTIVYTFRMDAGVRVLTVNYYYMCEPTGLQNSMVQKRGVKRIINGQIMVEKNGHLYNLLGSRID